MISAAYGFLLTPNAGCRARRFGFKKEVASAKPTFALCAALHKALPTGPRH